MGNKIKYFKGQRLSNKSMLTYICDVNSKNKNRAALFKCDCGVEKIVLVMKVISLKTRSCGCYRTSQRVKNATKHNMSASLEYKSWANMLQRCNNPLNTGYKNYGGRGVCVSSSWINFENFYFDMGPKPTPKHQIDRIDNNGNYNKKNCRWATVSENLRNQSNSKFWFIEGNKYESCLDAAIDLGVSPSTIRAWCGLSKRHNKKQGCHTILRYK